MAISESSPSAPKRPLGVDLARRHPEHAAHRVAHHGLEQRAPLEGEASRSRGRCRP